jgi:hypothetical protein
VQPEPLLLLTDRSITVETPASEADIEVGGTRLWRTVAPELDPGRLLIADGHHRYECAVDLARERGGEETRIMVLVVSKGDPGLHVFPTHRVFAGRPDLADLREGESCRDLDEAFAMLRAESYERSVAIGYRRGASSSFAVNSELDAELVDRHGLEGITYTPRVEEALGAVDRREADVAFLLRDPEWKTFAVALRGERMPAKSTYFYPKPLSGLLSSTRPMTPWLETCRACVGDIRGVLDRLPTRTEREPVLRRGEGGTTRLRSTRRPKTPSSTGSGRSAATSSSSPRSSARASSARRAADSSSSIRLTGQSTQSVASRSSRSRSP